MHFLFESYGKQTFKFYWYLYFLDWWNFIKLPVTVCCLFISTLYIFTTLNMPAHCFLTARSVLRQALMSLWGSVPRTTQFYPATFRTLALFYLLKAWKSLGASLFGIISTWNFSFLYYPSNSGSFSIIISFSLC